MPAFYLAETEGFELQPNYYCNWEVIRITKYEKSIYSSKQRSIFIFRFEKVNY
jgi:hypothetical protein